MAEWMNWQARHATQKLHVNWIAMKRCVVTRSQLTLPPAPPPCITRVEIGDVCERSTVNTNSRIALTIYIDLYGRWTCSLAFATNRIDRYVYACVGYLLVFILLWKHSARIRNIIDIYRANDRARTAFFSFSSHSVPSTAINGIDGTCDEFPKNIIDRHFWPHSERNYIFSVFFWQF